MLCSSQNSGITSQLVFFIYLLLVFLRLFFNGSLFVQFVILQHAFTINTVSSYGHANKLVVLVVVYGRSGFLILAMIRVAAGSLWPVPWSKCC